MFWPSKRNKKCNQPQNTEEEYEFCPRCEANLTLQKGYQNDLPYWVCKGCGQMLINPEAEGETAWICDQCGSMLNVQNGFSEHFGQWKCIECGKVARIDNSALYLSQEEYLENLKNPYKGLSDESVIALMEYQDVECLDGREDIILIKDSQDTLLVEKFLKTYNRSIYEYLMKHPVEYMPKLQEIYESANCLIVIEEYIKGRTLADVIQDGAFDMQRAIRIARDICIILQQLHSLDSPIIHRDVKPSNIMLTDNDEVFLLDVNAAKWFDPKEIEDTRLLGTWYYAAPEQLGYGFSASSKKADIYAVGVLLNVMLTGALPKERRATGLAWDVIKKCISLEPDERYTDEELISELNDILRCCNDREVNE